MASRSKKKKMLRQFETRETLKQLSKPTTIIELTEAYSKGFNAGYEKGREEGFKQAALVSIQRMYGAVLLAAKELYGFGQERGIRLLNKVNYLVIEMLSDEELAQRVLDEVGVEIDWGQPIELAQPKEPMKGARNDEPTDNG